MNFFLALAISLLTLPTPNKEVSWTFKSKRVKPRTYVITAKATINSGWYVYSQYLESDKGPISTYLSFEENFSAKLVDRASEAGEKVEGFDPLFNMNITKYKKELLIKQTVTIPKGQRYLKGSITFMSCNDNQCMPPDEVPFELKL